MNIQLKQGDVIIINGLKYHVGFCLFDNDIILTCLDVDVPKPNFYNSKE